MVISIYFHENSCLFYLCTFWQDILVYILVKKSSQSLINSFFEKFLVFKIYRIGRGRKKTLSYIHTSKKLLDSCQISAKAAHTDLTHVKGWIVISNTIGHRFRKNDYLN